MMGKCLKKCISLILIITMMCFSSIIMTGCGEEEDVSDGMEYWDEDYDSYDSGSEYDDWDTDNNGEADWHDVDTDNDGNVSADEMNNYLDDWEEEENNENDESGGNSVGGQVSVPGY